MTRALNLLFSLTLAAGTTTIGSGGILVTPAVLNNALTIRAADKSLTAAQHETVAGLAGSPDK